MKNKKVKCEGCGKPILIDELGAIINGKFYHDNIVCLIKASVVKKQKIKPPAQRL